MLSYRKLVVNFSLFYDKKIYVRMRVDDLHQIQKEKANLAKMNMDCEREKISK